MERLKKFAGPLGYVLLFIFSFIFFVYFTFPYTVLKEAIVSGLGKETGLIIRIDEFSPSLPLGFEAEGIRISGATGGNAIELKDAEISIGIFNLLVGRLAVYADLTSKNDGTLSVVVKNSLVRMLFEKNFLPSKLELEAEKFAVGHLVGFALAHYANSASANPMFSGMLTQIGFEGNLDGAVDMDLDLENFALSEGLVNLQFRDAVLRIDDPALNLADQKFSKALIKANIASGTAVIAKESGFHTQELVVDLSGDLKLKKELSRSTMDVEVNLKLDKGLKDQFGFVLDMAGGAGGVVKYQMRGTVGHPNVITM